MNFSKYRIREREILSEMMDYCSKIISHRRKEDERFLDVSVCISTRSGGVEIKHNEETIIVIRYDDRSNFYYFLEKMSVGKRVLNKRIIIEDKDDFYSYFNHVVQKT